MLLLSCDPSVTSPAFALFFGTGKRHILDQYWQAGDLTAKKRAGWWNDHILYMRTLQNDHPDQPCFFACEGQYVSPKDRATKAGQDNIRSVLALARMHGKLQLAAHLAGWMVVEEGVNPLDWMPNVLSMPLKYGSARLQARSLTVATALAHSCGLAKCDRINNHNIAAAVCIGLFAWNRINSAPEAASGCGLSPAAVSSRASAGGAVSSKGKKS